MRGTTETAIFFTREDGLYLPAPSSGHDIMPWQISNKLEVHAVDGMDIPGASSILCVVVATTIQRGGSRRYHAFVTVFYLDGNLFLEHVRYWIGDIIPRTLDCTKVDIFYFMTLLLFH